MTDEPEVDLTDPNETFTCWCGVSGTFDELFSDDVDEACGGTGTIHCYCGGDQCVCHNHGEIECLGCEDCEGEDDGYDEEDYEDDRP